MLLNTAAKNSSERGNVSLTEITDILGTTTDIAGTSSTGTLNAKANALLDQQNLIYNSVKRMESSNSILTSTLLPRIACRAYFIGTAFTISQTDGADWETQTLYIESDTYKDANGLYWLYVAVPPGNFHIVIKYNGVSDEVDIEATTSGQTYTFTYENYVLLQTFTSSGTFTVPSKVDVLYVTGIGGGGSGGGAYGGYSVTSAGGGGGGGGQIITKMPYNVTPGSSISITIGTAGAAQTYGAAGVAGGATKVGSLVTLAGGTGGGIGGRSNADTLGTGGTGGAGGTYGGSSGAAAANNASSAGGKGGRGLNSSGAQTTGGGAGGAAGDGTRDEYAPSGGTATAYGAGGGGGGGSGWRYQLASAGGAGRAGIVLLYKGLVLK